MRSAAFASAVLGALVVGVLAATDAPGPLARAVVVGATWTLCTLVAWIVAAISYADSRSASDR